MHDRQLEHARRDPSLVVVSDDIFQSHVQVHPVQGVVPREAGGSIDAPQGAVHGDVPPDYGRHARRGYESAAGEGCNKRISVVSRIFYKRATNLPQVGQQAHFCCAYKYLNNYIEL